MGMTEAYKKELLACRNGDMTNKEIAQESKIQGQGQKIIWFLLGKISLYKLKESCLLAHGSFFMCLIGHSDLICKKTLIYEEICDKISHTERGGSYDLIR